MSRMEFSRSGMKGRTSSWFEVSVTSYVFNKNLDKIKTKRRPMIAPYCRFYKDVRRTMQTSANVVKVNQISLPQKTININQKKR